MTNDIERYGPLFEEDTESSEYKLELLALRLSHMIADALHTRGMNRVDLARELGVSAPMVTKILSGRSNFTLKTLVGLADALDYEFDPVFKPKGYKLSVDYVKHAAAGTEPLRNRIGYAQGIVAGSGPSAPGWKGIGLDSRVDNDEQLAA